MVLIIYLIIFQISADRVWAGNIRRRGAACPSVMDGRATHCWALAHQRRRRGRLCDRIRRRSRHSFWSKAGERVPGKDLAGLRKLRRAAGSRFIAGGGVEHRSAVLHLRGQDSRDAHRPALAVTHREQFCSFGKGVRRTPAPGRGPVRGWLSRRRSAAGQRSALRPRWAAHPGSAGR